MRHQLLASPSHPPLPTPHTPPPHPPPPPHPTPPQSTHPGNQTETMATVPTPFHNDLEWNPATSIGIGVGLVTLILVAVVIVVVTTGCIYYMKRSKKTEKTEGREAVRLLHVVVPPLPLHIPPSSLRGPPPSSVELISSSNGENCRSSLSRQQNSVSSQLPWLQIRSDSVDQGCDSKTVSCENHKPLEVSHKIVT